MAATFTLPTLPEVTAALRGERRDHYRLFDSVPEFVARCEQDDVCRKGRDKSPSFLGGVTFAQALKMAREGDAGGVAKSDALLAKMEALDLYAPRVRVRDGVAGGVPNVPAFLAGHPLNMRRRVREDDNASPLAVVVDLASSGGIDAAVVQKRGVAILALVRALTARRPVELYVGCSLDADDGENAVHVYARVETTPMDLLRAAHWISHPSFPRGLIYSAGRALNSFCGKWPYSRGPLTAENGRAIMARALPHADAVLYIPGVFMGDRLVTAPEAWVAEQLAKHAGDADDVQFAQDAAA